MIRAEAPLPSKVAQANPIPGSATARGTGE